VTNSFQNPSFQATRAITIDAAPAMVWPWIVQMGFRRAGFYTYALLDNAGYPSADRVLAGYQQPKVGDWMPVARKVTETTVMLLEFGDFSMVRRVLKGIKARAEQMQASAREG
jgi:hypothetical protein